MRKAYRTSRKSMRSAYSDSGIQYKNKQKRSIVKGRVQLGGYSVIEKTARSLTTPETPSTFLIIDAIQNLRNHVIHFASETP